MTQSFSYSCSPQVFPNLPLTEVLFLSKVLDRVLFIAQRGDEHGWEIVRPFSSLVDHKEEIRFDFEKIIDYLIATIHAQQAVSHGFEFVEKQTEDFLLFLKKTMVFLNKKKYQSPEQLQNFIKVNNS